MLHFIHFRVPDELINAYRMMSQAANARTARRLVSLRVRWKCAIVPPERVQHFSSAHAEYLY